MKHLCVIVLAIVVGFSWSSQRQMNCYAEDSIQNGSKPSRIELICERLIDAVNSGDKSKILAFVEAEVLLPPGDSSAATAIAERLYSFNTSRDAVKLERYVERSPNSLRAYLSETVSDGWMELVINLDDQTSSANFGKIVGLGINSISTPAELLPKVRLSDEDVSKRLKQLVEPMIERDSFSGSVLVRRGNSILYERHAGFADEDRKLPVTSDRRFNLASITKMFTAVAIAQLVENGKLNWDDQISDLLKDYPNQEVAHQITVTQLLSHTSGLPGAYQTVNEKLMPLSARTVVESFGTASEKPLSFRPGQQFDYSNFGFAVLGRIIEVVSGENYHDYIRKHVFLPAGMTHTDFADLATHPGNIAIGWMDSPEGRKNNRSQLSVIGLPYGGAFSTAEDLERFRVALMSNVLVSAKTRELMWTGITESQPDVEYGLGAEISTYNGIRFIHHGGGWPGVTNQFEFSPRLDTTLVILSNYDIDTRSIVNRVRQWLAQGTVNGEDNRKPDFEIAASVASKSIAKDEPAGIELKVANRGGIAHSCVVDLELKNSDGKKVQQQFVMHQRFEPNQTQSYKFNWTSESPGSYSVSAGVFGPGWANKHLFRDNLAELRVR